MPESLFSLSAAGPMFYFGVGGPLIQLLLPQLKTMKSSTRPQVPVDVILWLGPQISAGPTDVCLSWCILRLCCFAPSLSQALHESLRKRVVSPKDFKSPCQGLPWWLSGTESTYQCRRQGFDSWSRKIPRAMVQLLSLCSRAWELHPLSPHTLTLCSTSREAAARRSCLTAMERSQLLAAPREKPAQH